MEEIWKDIEGYEELYQISSLARCKSLARVVTHWNGSSKKIKERILKPNIINKIYVGYHLSKNKKVSIGMAHRLVAKAFIENPNNYPCVLHIKESVPLDNSLSNLRWGTHKMNTQDMISKGRAMVGEKNVNFGKYRGNHHASKIVLNTQYGIYYDCVQDAADSIGANLRYLRAMLSGNKKNKTSLIYA